MWSEQFPTREGYYWYSDQQICDVVRVTRSSDGQLIATGTALFERHPVETLKGVWAGPIPVPERKARGPVPVPVS